MTTRPAQQITDEQTLQRIRALRIPPAWENVWISADPLGHIQATGVDSKGRTQYLYHQLWREQRDAQKFSHMLRFASALPGLRTATQHDLRRRPLNRDRVSAGVVRLIDLGLFRIGGEKYAELDHHYGATTLEKRHVRVTRDGVLFDYVAKAGKQRTIMVKDRLVLPTVRALIAVRQRRRGPVLLRARRRLAPAALPGRGQLPRRPGPEGTTRPRSSAPGTPPS